MDSENALTAVTTLPKGRRKEKIANSSTTLRLLRDLNDPEESRVWGRFCERYRPILEAFGRRRGFCEADVDELVHQTLCAFLERWRGGEFDLQTLRLRSWLFSALRSRTVDLWRQRKREPRASDLSPEGALPDAMPSAAELSRSWVTCWREAAQLACMQELAKHATPRAMGVFILYVLQGWPAEKVAEEYKVNRNAVFLTKHALIGKIRRCARKKKLDWQEGRI